MKRSKPHYKPVALLIALGMYEDGLAFDGVFAFDDFCERFSERCSTWQRPQW